MKKKYKKYNKIILEELFISNNCLRDLKYIYSEKFFIQKLFPIIIDLLSSLRKGIKMMLFNEHIAIFSRVFNCIFLKNLSLIRVLEYDFKSIFHIQLIQW